MATTETEIARLLTITAAAYAAECNASTRAWLAANPGGWATTLVEDAAHWAAQGVETGLDLAHLLAAETVSDLHKEVRGIRPRWLTPALMSLTELENLIEALVAEGREQAEAEARWAAEEEARWAARESERQESEADAWYEIQDRMAGAVR